MKEPSVPNPQEARLEASVEMGTLCAFYGGLLTDKQLQAMQLHFDEDLSLGEIARQMNVSRQNVHDLIARSSESSGPAKPPSARRDAWSACWSGWPGCRSCSALSPGRTFPPRLAP